MSSRLIASSSAALLFVSGAALLFAADVIVPAGVAGFDAAHAWLAQLLGGAWLGLAAVNWLTRRTVLGGIYGRPVVLANLWMYFINTTVLADAASAANMAIVTPAGAVSAVMAVAYGVLLFRAPGRQQLPPPR